MPVNTRIYFRMGGKKLSSLHVTLSLLWESPAIELFKYNFYVFLHPELRAETTVRCVKRHLAQ